MFGHKKLEEKIEAIEKECDKARAIVERLENKYNWCMDNPNKFNGKLAYELKQIIDGK